MNLKCAIVDDEPLALNLLESYVNKTPFLELAVASLPHTSRRNTHSLASRIMQMLPVRQYWICVKISHRRWQHARQKTATIQSLIRKIVSLRLYFWL